MRNYVSWSTEAKVNQAPLVVSILSIVMAAFALGWNVYRDVVLKAHMKVAVSTMTMINGSEIGVGLSKSPA